MDVNKMKEILKKEYGINSYEEFEEALKKSEGIDIGLFTTPIPDNEVKVIA